MVSIGTDIVYIPKFAEKLESAEFVRKVFNKSELEKNTAEHLAGVFAAKEAFIKAKGRKIDWLDIQINYQNGKPMIEGSDVSISHDKDYAVAVVLNG